MVDPQIINYPAANWSDRKGQAIVAIVVHGTGGGLKSSLQTLQTGDGRGVSINALIAQDGTIYRMLQDDKGANHAGAATSSFTLHGKTYTGGAVNRATLGVELVNLQDGRDPYTPLQLQSLGWLINFWRAKHGPLPILRHGDLDPTRRRDPYQLTTNTIEIWVAKAAGAATTPPVSLPLTPPATKRYRVRRILISQRREGGLPYAGELQPGQVVEVDQTYSDTHTAHLASGLGFVRLEDLEAV
jgi:hypothetical protein